MLGIVQALLATLVITVPAPVRLGHYSFAAEYSVSFLGVPVAYSKFNSTFDGEAFSVNGVVSAGAIAQLFDDTRASISAAGHFAGRTTQPTRFRAHYTEGEKDKTTSINFKDGTVTKTANRPALGRRGGDWVALQKRHLSSVTDPLSATLVRADGLNEVCERTIRIYDGEMRTDLTLSQQSKGKVTVIGYEGETVTCRVGFKPVAGYRKGRQALNYLKENGDITITFAPLGATGVYAPISATVGTEIGTIAIQASRFEAVEPDKTQPD